MVVGSSAMETHCNQCILSYPILFVVGSLAMHSMWPLAVHTHPSVESPLCCMCGLHDETEEHVLMHCPYLDLMQPEDLDFGTSLSDFLRQDSELVASWIHQCWSYLSDAKRSQTP